jgi:MoaA/NifB/PqqE/SkfB family radical SAM enzyme/SAM-dependent methyltransferase
MAFRRERWSRIVFEGVPIYIQPDHPHWFVPNADGDRLLERLRVDPAARVNPSEACFLARLPEIPEPSGPYPGREAFLSTERLDELWLHVTDRCDMACRHCLFSCSPKKTAEMPAGRILDLASQAHRLGARVFALTGGEPLLHRECHRVLAGLLELDDSNLVILTNGMSVRRHARFLARLPRERVHLQVSVDGTEPGHDHLRGKGAFGRLKRELGWLRGEDWAFTVSSCIDRRNLHEVVSLVETAAELGASALHLLWYFARGRGNKAEVPDTDLLADGLIRAAIRAEALGVGIDNLDAVRSRVFAPAGTKHDGPSSGWYSLAVAPDGRLYPSPALVGIEDLSTEVNGDLAASWRTSPVLSRLRSTSVAANASPLRFLLGGGDYDHSYVSTGSFSGGDPYLPVYETLALWSIARFARRQGKDGPPRLRAMMGDLLETCSVENEVALTHSNCVLSLTSEHGTTAVGRFYTSAVETARKDILNPVYYDAGTVAHIPPAGRVRGYGCGSPVLDARLAPGESVVDLGSGMGMECFIAAKHVGSRGRVTGIDMLDPMLDRANRTAEGVRANLGYDNLRFKKGLLEALPLEDSCADVVISNCVLNLSHDKRRIFAEIGRILRPGGRLVVSDVVCESDPGPAMRADETMLGECLGGALTQRDLFGLLDEAGLVGAEVLNRFPYREVRGHRFFSMTFRARKPADRETLRVIYRGPFAALLAPDGTLLPAGQSVTLSADHAERLSDQVFVLDGEGAVANVDLGTSSCCTPAGTLAGTSCCGPAGAASPAPALSSRERAGCMICGSELKYATQEKRVTCSYCGNGFFSAMVCPEGHFVCDACHAADARAIIERVCLSSDETDMVALLRKVRSHPSVSVHGPEHHALVPGIILAACRNAGTPLTDEQVLEGIRRGSAIPGGACGYLGICGAASGAGAAFSVLLEATPLKKAERRQVMSIEARILERIAGYEAARCCQRECYLALKEAAGILPDVVRTAPRAEADLRCDQLQKNADCLGRACPLHPRSTAVLFR